MKTIEEKAKAYDSIIEKANKMHSENCEACKACIEELIPELAESEDERIRKMMIKYFESCGNLEWYDGLTPQKAIAWLEKQGEQKPADTVEPKFNVGDKIRRKTPSSFDKDMQVARIEKDYYVCNHIGKFSSEVVPFSKQSSYELIEQKPAWSEDDETVLNNLIYALENDRIGNNRDEYIDWLKSIKSRVGCEAICTTTKEWSEEDKDYFDAIIAKLEVTQEDAALTDNQMNFLKSLKGKIQPKPEWSEEDAVMLNKLLAVVELYYERSGNDLDKQSCITWLKSLRPQNRWKPTDEQIKVCKEVYADLLSAKGFDIGTVVSELNRMEEELKKLKKE